MSSSMSSILWLSLVMFISPYSNLVSVSLYFCCRLWIFSTSFSSLPRAFSADFSSCFMFSPTVSSSSSTIFRFFSASSALSRPLLSSELPAELIQLLLIVVSHLDCGAEVLVQLLNGHLVVHAGGLDNLDSLEDVVSRLGGECELGDGGAEGVSGLLVLLLHEHDPPGKGGHVSLHFLELLLSLLQRLGGLGQLVVGLVEADLKGLDFLSIVSDVAVSLVGSGCGFLGGILESLDGCIEAISLAFKALHLLADGVHFQDLLV